MGWRRYANRGKEEVIDLESQSGHYSLEKLKISLLFHHKIKKYWDVRECSVCWRTKVRSWKNEEVCVTSPQNGTNIDLTVTSESDPMSVDNTDDELVLTISLIDTPKPYSQPSTST